MGLTVLFTHLKIILLQYFQFLIFNFYNNKLNPNGPIVNNNSYSKNLHKKYINLRGVNIGCGSCGWIRKFVAVLVGATFLDYKILYT